VPNKWLRLGTAPASAALANGVANVIRRRPNLRYDNAEGEGIWEWRLEDADQRWQEIQGKPAYRNPSRLNGDQH
jgi:hypothetical protein